VLSLTLAGWAWNAHSNHRPSPFSAPSRLLATPRFSPRKLLWLRHSPQHFTTLRCYLYGSHAAMLYLWSSRFLCGWNHLNSSVRPSGNVRKLLWRLMAVLELNRTCPNICPTTRLAQWQVQASVGYFTFLCIWYMYKKVRYPTDIALLRDEHMLRSALQSRKWQLIGMS